MKQQSLLWIAIVALTTLSSCAAVTKPALYTALEYVPEATFTSGVEGPAVGPDGALYAVNFEREGTIGRVVPNQQGIGQAELFVTLPEGSTGNGLRFNARGDLFVADYTGHNILKIPAGSRQAQVFAHNNEMHQPNDIALLDSGVLFASDPSWATNTGNLWRISEAGHVTLVEANMGTTNGVAISPDQRRLYVNESVQRRIWLYDVDEAGHAHNKRLFYQFDDFGLDGMRVDAHGRLIVARYGAGSVALLSPEGQLIRDVTLRGKNPTNVALDNALHTRVYVTVQDRGNIEVFTIE